MNPPMGQKHAPQRGLSCTAGITDLPKEREGKVKARDTVSSKP